ncbi:hypothetical protein DYB36_012698 [Aphanomyces astaci]|uniref:Secreted protein n=1 Tax=Aphanomyces astaci TaxID=112090 RepID=A0A397A7C2_APHAT|nr:hypothetical protein DYB36_012698 [Aphanomyces astaci]
MRVLSFWGGALSLLLHSTAATDWKCIPGNPIPFSLSADGEVQCWSLNHHTCYNNGDCQSTINSAPDAPDPLVCGAMHQKAYGYTGYDYGPEHWCNFAKDALVPVWKCLEDVDATLGPWANSPMSLDANGDVQCWSNNGRECYVAPEGCKATITSGAKPLSKMVCGCDILSKFGNTGYDQGPRSFCNFAQKALNASPPNLPCTPPSAVCTFKDGDVIGLQADTGEFVGRCNGCLRKPRTTWDVILLGPLSYSTKWTVRNIPHIGKITLVLDTGAYLGRCHGCAGEATLPDQAFAVPPSGINYLVDPNVQWTCEEAGPDNRIALKGDMGTYLSRCHGCVPIIGGVPDAMFMHARDWRSNGPAQFTLHRLPSTPPTMLAVKSSHDNSVESVDEATVAGTVVIAVAGCVGVVVAAMTMHRRRNVRRQGFVRV